MALPRRASRTDAAVRGSMTSMTALNVRSSGDTKRLRSRDAPLTMAATSKASKESTALMALTGMERSWVVGRSGARGVRSAAAVLSTASLSMVFAAASWKALRSTAVRALLRALEAASRAWTYKAARAPQMPHEDIDTNFF